MGAPGTTRPGPPDRILEEHGDALYDFALSVTGEAAQAVAAVREAVPAAVGSYGPGVSRPVLFGSVFAVAVRDAALPPVLDAGLIEPGPASPDELQRLTRAATVLLDPVQRGCLDLALRQGLEGEELSEALGVAPGLASVSVQTATDRAEDVIGAVLLTRVGRNDCPGLADVALESVGLAADKLATGVVEHGESCAACGDRRRALVPVTALLAGIPAVPAPAALKRFDPRRRAGIVGALRPPGRRVPFPALVQRAHPWRRGFLAATAVAAVLVVAVAVVGPRRGDEIAPVAAPGGQLTVDAAPLDFGPDSTQAGVRVTNSGREPLVFEARSAVPWISFAGGEGILDPGESVVVSALLDRLRAPEGAPDTEIRIRSNGGSAAVPVRVLVERAPEVSSLQVTPQAVVVSRCPGSTPAQVRAAVIEESGLASVQLHWVRHGIEAEQVSPMSAETQSAYRGALGPFNTPGHVHWWMTAVDIRNNRVATPQQELRVGDC